MSMTTTRHWRMRWLATVVIAGGSTAAALGQLPRGPAGAPVVPISAPLPMPMAPMTPALAIPPAPVPVTTAVEPPFRFPSPGIPNVPPISTPVAMPTVAAPSRMMEGPVTAVEVKPAPTPEDEPLDKPFRTAVKPMPSAVPATTVARKAPPASYAPAIPVEHTAPAPAPTLLPMATEPVASEPEIVKPSLTRTRPAARPDNRPVIQVVQEDTQGDEPPATNTIRVVIGRETAQISGPLGSTPVPAPAIAHTAIPVAHSAIVSTDAACSSCGTAGCGGGCSSSCWGKHWACFKAPATVPPVLGSTTQGIFMMQRNGALAEYFVVYREDFLADSTTLNRSGDSHLGGIVRRLNMIGAPVKVEPTGNSELDQRRRITVVDALVQRGVSPSEAQGRVIMGDTRAEGLRGLDIEALPYPNIGYGNGGGGSGSGGSGAAGFGGGGGGGFGGYGGFR